MRKQPKPDIAVFVVMTSSDQVNSLWKWVNDNGAFVDTSMDRDGYEGFLNNHKRLQEVEKIKDKLKQAVKLLTVSPEIIPIPEVKS